MRNLHEKAKSADRKKDENIDQKHESIDRKLSIQIRIRSGDRQRRADLRGQGLTTALRGLVALSQKKERKCSH